MIQLDSFRKCVGHLEDIRIVVRSARLQHALQNPVRIEPFLTSDVKRLRHDRDEKPAISRQPHSQDAHVFERGFREIRSGRERIRKSSAGRVGLSRSAERRSRSELKHVAGEGIVVNRRRDVLDRLAD